MAAEKGASTEKMRRHAKKPKGDYKKEVTENKNGVNFQMLTDPYMKSVIADFSKSWSQVGPLFEYF